MGRLFEDVEPRKPRGAGRRLTREELKVGMVVRLNGFTPEGYSPMSGKVLEEEGKILQIEPLGVDRRYHCLVRWPSCGSTGVHVDEIELVEG